MRVNLLLRGFGLQHNDGMFRLDALNLTFNGTPAPRFIRSAKDFHFCHGSQLEKGGLPTPGQGQVVAPSGGVKISRDLFFQKSDGADWGCICNMGVVLVSCSEES